MEKKRQIAAVLILLALIGVIAYRHSTGKDLEKYEASFFDVFDTQTQIIGYASSKEQFSEQMSLIKDKFQYYNDLYDIYHDYEGMNNIKTINDNAGIQPVKVDEEIIELLKLGITMDEKTDGNMNIAMGSVLSIWHDYREAGSEDPDSAELPPMDELERAAEHTDIHNIVIDEEASTVYLTDPDMSLDVGSIGKGYAVQKVAEYAKNELGIQYMLFSVGGNVCYWRTPGWKRLGGRNSESRCGERPGIYKKSGSSGFKRGDEWELSTLLYSRWKKILSHYQSGYPDAGR